MTEAEQQICRYFDQRKNVEFDHNEFGADSLEVDKALKTAPGFLVLSHHPTDVRDK